MKSHYIVSLKRPDGRQESVPVTCASWDRAIALAKKKVGWPEDKGNEVLCSCQKAGEEDVIVE